MSHEEAVQVDLIEELGDEEMEAVAGGAVYAGVWDSIGAAPDATFSAVWD